MARSAIVVVVDRLGAAYLGPYGCTWLETPACNRLASESLLVETCLAETPDLGAAYDTYWNTAGSLPGALAASGVKTSLLTDDASVAEHPLATAFAERNLIASGAATEAKTVEETSLAALFAAAEQWLQSAREPFLLWVHAQGMQGPWDAPWEMRASLADEEDPPPPHFVDPPEGLHTTRIDPDERLGLVQAYGAQVQALDECLSNLHALVAELPFAQELLFALTSPRGYPLGEHGRIGPCDQALYAELLQIPLLVRLPDRACAAARTQHLFQPRDLGPAVAAWCLQDESSELLAVAQGNVVEARELALARSEGQRALRTPAWFLREDLRGAEPIRELYVKPDDRFEVNEIASRGGAVVDQMLTQLAEAERQAAAGERLSLLPETESLRNLWR
jgi:hypothetical protein